MMMKTKMKRASRKGAKAQGVESGYARPIVKIAKEIYEVARVATDEFNTKRKTGIPSVALWGEANEQARNWCLAIAVWHYAKMSEART